MGLVPTQAISGAKSGFEEMMVPTPSICSNWLKRECSNTGADKLP